MLDITARAYVTAVTCGKGKECFKYAGEEKGWRIFRVDSLTVVIAC